MTKELEEVKYNNQIAMDVIKQDQSSKEELKHYNHLKGVKINKLRTDLALAVEALEFQLKFQKENLTIGTHIAEPEFQSILHIEDVLFKINQAEG